MLQVQDLETDKGQLIATERLGQLHDEMSELLLATMSLSNGLLESNQHIGNVIKSQHQVFNMLNCK